ncbi:conserved hypothetical protein [Chloroherpeton thalassium ATCC 35110]|uniref:Methionine synthase n=1 Tax=Chloroherpeton thalassium (strain ATCC 35110 / GB-78) TaxID=517418 RepID=B3QY33_CHLT3|nr:hypothetical protein [Chloroherpeton thalassium]ACF14999.1 conserved hypothetical protein [Chloroherpeton thalassium ATCC 35110]
MRNLRIPKPNGAVTGIGSLPLGNANDAVETVTRYAPEFPFWPQLPKRAQAELMLEHALFPFMEFFQPCQAKRFGYELTEDKPEAFSAALKKHDGALSEENAAGFFAFENAFAKGAFAQAKAVKGQLVGPVTLASLLFQKEKSFLSDDRLFAQVLDMQRKAALWQIERLGKLGLPVIVFFDEPALMLLSTPAYSSAGSGVLEGFAKMIFELKNTSATIGVHSCASVPYNLMQNTAADILSFDADLDLETFAGDSDFNGFVAGNGLAAYGLVPNDSEKLQTLSAAAIFERWQKAFGQTGFKQIVENGFVTASCGMGLLGENEMIKSFELQSEVSKLVKKI